MRKVPWVDTDIIEFSTLQSPCVYIEGEHMKMAYKYIKDCSLALNSKLTQRGWRRFGHYYSRPTCETCSACQSIRINVDDFQYTKSVNRIIRKNEDTDILIVKPSVTSQHLSLYEKYHTYMQDKKGWEYYPVCEDSYRDLYARGFSSYGYEVQYIRDEKLVGVDLVDFLEDGISAIYFYYDPDYAHLALGKYSIFKQIEFAKRKALRWVYLGYYVKECSSLNYKDDYKPNQILLNNPCLNDTANWQ